MKTDHDRRPRTGPASPNDAEPFLAVAVHELRAPATVMVGSAETLIQLLDGVAVPTRAHEVIAMLARNGRYLGRLIDDLLSSAFLDHGSLPLNASRVPLRPILGWAADAAGAVDGEVTIECDPLLHATVDADRFEQIVTNLVANAIAHGAAPVTVTATALT